MSATPVVRVRDVVSDGFTGWDLLTQSEGEPSWCSACEWAHSEVNLRLYPWLIINGFVGQGAPKDLLRALSRPLAPNEAVIVPVARKKHLVPAARWGVLTTDDGCYPWGAVEVTRLQALGRLRTLGFSEKAVTEEAPRFDVLKTLKPSEQIEVFAFWLELASWRRTPLLLAVALRATRAGKTG